MSNTDVPAGQPTGRPTASTGPAAGDVPPKMRVHALAKLLAISSRDVLAALAELGSAARSPQSSVDRGTALQVIAALLPDGEEPLRPTDEAEAVPADALENSDVPTDVRSPVFAPPVFGPPVFLPPQARPAPAQPEPSAEPADSEEPDDTDEVDDETGGARRRRRRGRRGRGRGKGGPGDEADADSETGDAEADAADGDQDEADEDASGGEDVRDSEDSDGEQSATAVRRRRRRRRKGTGDEENQRVDDPPNTVVHVRETPREAARAERAERADTDEVQSVRGSTRLEAKRQRRRDGREAGRRRTPIVSEAEFLTRRESVERTMVVRQRGDRSQIGVLEDGVLVEHFVTSADSASIVGNVYLGRVQNVLPSMEAAFVDIGRGRNAVLYAGEVDWDTAGLQGRQRRIEQALSSGDSVVVQVSKDPVGHKGARLTTQLSLPGRFLVYVPSGGATGISRKLPDVERRRLKDLLKQIVPDEAGVIIRTASEGVTEAELDRDVRRLQAQWEVIKTRTESKATKAPAPLYEEPDLLIKVVRDLFNEDFAALVVSGDDAWDTIEAYVRHVAPELLPRLRRHVGPTDVFTDLRIDEQILKALDRKVWLPSGGTLVIDRTEAMTVIDVNTGKFTGSGGNLEETVTRNNLEAAEEIVRQLRLRDIGGIIVMDFIDMVLESNRELVLRRLTECLGRDRTRHQVAEVTSLGLVQMTRKRVGTSLLDAYSTPCEHCHGRGLIVSIDQLEPRPGPAAVPPIPDAAVDSRRSRGRGRGAGPVEIPEVPDAAGDDVAAPTSAAPVRTDLLPPRTAQHIPAATAPDVAEPGLEPDPPSTAVAPAPAGSTGQTADSARNGRSMTALPEPVPSETEQPESGPDAAPEIGPDAAPEIMTDSVVEPSVVQRRRRRAVSRPAGPPAPVDGGSGAGPV